MQTNKSVLNTTNISVVILITLVALIVYYIYLVDDVGKNVKHSNVTEIYYADGITTTHLKLINKFNERFKERIKVIPIDLPFNKFSTNERKEILARTLRGKGSKIDVFTVDIVWAYRFAKWAENLSPYFNDQYLSNFIEPVLETCFFKDSLIAAPFTFDLSTLYYRDDILSKLPDYEELKSKLADSITWEELIRLGKRVNYKNPFYIFPASDYEGLVCSFLELIINQNKDFFKESVIDLTKPEAVKALDLLYDLIHEYKLTPTNVTGFTEFSSHKYFLDNDGLFVRSWPAFFLDIPDSSLVTFRNVINRAPMPHFEGTDPAAVYGGWNLVVSKFSEHIPEAIEFIKFLQEPESQSELVIDDISLPVIKSIYNDENFSAADVLTFYKNNLKYGVHRPLLEDYTRFSDITSFFVRKVLMDEMESKVALAEATRMINSNEVIFK